MPRAGQRRPMPTGHAPRETSITQRPGRFPAPDQGPTVLPDRHSQTKSKYTLDRQMPGAFEGETVTRRRLMTGTVHVAGAVAVSAIALPSLGFALGPIFEKKDTEWQPVGAGGDFTDDEYIPVV